MTICDPGLEPTSLTDTSARLVVFRGFDEVLLAGSEWGEIGDPVVLLLHGQSSTRHSWQLVGPGLTQSGFRVIALDARGHGDSGWAPENGNYRMETLAADVRRAVLQLDDKVALIGAGLGGTTGNMVAQEMGPSWIRSVTVADPICTTPHMMATMLLSV